VPVAPAAHYAMGGLWVDASGRTSLDGLWACGEAAASGLHGANRLASNSLLEALVLGRQAGESAAAGEAGSRAVEPRALRLPASAAPALWGRRRCEDPALRREIATLMWRHAGIVRQANGLTWALHELERLERSLPPGPSETRNLLELGRWLAAAALLREESRGAHQRADFPETCARALRTVAQGEELLMAARLRLALGERAVEAAVQAVSP
jgi:L-aspartate oxidase